jgi:hypothetical protein
VCNKNQEKEHEKNEEKEEKKNKGQSNVVTCESHIFTNWSLSF